MCRSEFKTALIISVVLLLSVRGYSQRINQTDSLGRYNSTRELFKPRLSYSAGSSFLFMPHMGSISGFNLTPQISVPLTTKLSVDGGFIAGHYYSTLRSFNSEGTLNGTFNALSIYGSATYYLNPRFIIYGSGIKQLAGNSPFNTIPKTSYSFGSAYKFGSFSIGVTVHMSRWNNTPGLMPFNGTHGYNSPFDIWQFH